MSTKLCLVKTDTQIFPVWQCLDHCAAGRPFGGEFTSFILLYAPDKGLILKHVGFILLSLYPSWKALWACSSMYLRSLLKHYLELLLNGCLIKVATLRADCDLAQLIWLTEEVSRLVIGLPWHPDCILWTSCDLFGIPKAHYFASREAQRCKLLACSSQFLEKYSNFYAACSGHEHGCSYSEAEIKGTKWWESLDP